MDSIVLLTGHDLPSGRELVNQFVHKFNYKIDKILVQSCTEFMDFEPIISSDKFIIISRLSRHDYNQINLMYELIANKKDFCIAANPLASINMIRKHIDYLADCAESGKLTMLYPNEIYRSICEATPMNTKLREAAIYTKIESKTSPDRAYRFACYEGFVASKEGFVL